MEEFQRLLTLSIIVIYWLLVAGVTLRVVFKKRPVSVSLAWLMMIYILPIFGVFVYLLLGELNLGRTRAERANNMFSAYRTWFHQLHGCNSHIPQKMPTSIAHIDDLCTNRMGIPAVGFNTLSLLTTPDTILDSITQDIQHAQQHIRLEFYIWNPGGKADQVAQALITAAQRGVKVELLLDSAGSHRFFHSKWAAMMQDAGIEVVQALKVNLLRIFLRRLDLRLHRKIITIDDNIAYTGSMNLVDPRFFKQSSGVGEWVDIMVRISGPTVNILSAIHAWDWEVETGSQHFPALPISNESASTTYELDNVHPIQVVPSGPGMPESLIQQVLGIAINRANSSVVITTPYLVPSNELLAILKVTAQRGVKVKIILPKKNDSIMVKWASRAYYSELLKAGIEIHEFHGGLLHTKSVIIDNQFCLVGTVNLDMRSLWLNFEVTLVVDDQAFTQKLVQVQDGYIQQSHQVELAQWSLRSLKFRLLERVFFLFGPLL